MARRPIFEEVGTDRPREGLRVGVIDRGTGGRPSAVRIWLAVLFCLVVLMIAVGGLTRLTRNLKLARLFTMCYPVTLKTNV